MSAPARRRDYVRNARAKRPTGCAWCGTDVPPPVTSASYCSDACVQADHDGIGDVPPVVPCRDPASMSEEEKSRVIARMNDSYNEWTATRRPGTER